MASKLNTTDKNLLTSGTKINIGNKPYENGLFGTRPERDYIYFELKSLTGGTLNFKKIPFSEIEIDDEGKLLLKPVKELVAEDIQTGAYQVNYQFYRQLAGDETTLLTTTQQNDQGYFTIWEDTNAIEILDNGEIYASGPNGERGQALQLDNLTLQVDAISPSRGEVRLKTKSITGNKYLENFARLGESVRRTAHPNIGITFGTLNDIDNFETNTNVMTIIPEIQESSGPPPGYSAGSSGPPPSGTQQIFNFLFTPRMVGGTVYVNNVYLVDTITSIPRTEANIIVNSELEDLEKDTYSEVIKLGDKFPWDENLHANAVRATGWSAGYLHWFENNDTWKNSTHLGYWAHIVQGEGIDGGNCMKFPDINQSFAEEYTQWPLENPHRALLIAQHIPHALNSLGVGHQDNVVVSFQVKSSVPNKPMRVSLKYANFLDQEPQPTESPDGFFNPITGAFGDEESPINPPDDYYPPTVANAQLIEAQPPQKWSTIINFFNLEEPVFDFGVGDNTAALGGTGVWVAVSSSGGSNPIFEWAVNTGNSNFQDSAGELSEGGNWQWNGQQWVTYPEPSTPTPIVQTVNGVEYTTVHPNDFPNAVNAHNYAIQNQNIQTRRPLFPRNAPSDTNFEYGAAASSGWVNWLAGNGFGSVDNTLDFRKWILLGKQDQVWLVKYNEATISPDTYYCYDWDKLFPQLRATEIERVDGDGNITTISLYEDIFQYGYIQDITCARFRDTGLRRFQFGSYHVFYNDGMGNTDSNKSFRVDTYNPGDSTAFPPIEGVFKIADLDAPFNEKINDNGGMVKWAGRRKNGTQEVRYYAFTGNEYYRVDDGNGDLYELDDDNQWIESDYPRIINDDGFKQFEMPCDVVIEEDPSHKTGDYSGYVQLIGKRLRKRYPGDDEHKPWDTITEHFFGAGEFDTGGEDFIFGTRNPGTENWMQDADGNPLPRVPDYDDGSGIEIVGDTPDKVGTLSPEEFWVWSEPDDQSSVYYWKFTGPVPPRYTYVRPGGTNAPIYRTSVANEWESAEVIIPVRDDWRLEAPGWQVVFEGHDFTDTNTFGVSWVDAVDVRFELVNETTQQEIKKPFVAQIQSVSDDGTQVTLNKTFADGAIEVGDDDNPATAFYQEGTAAGSYTGFDVSYTIFNPRELRTYLKFGNQFFLTTNFRQDRAAVTKWPHSIVYKLYEPLPGNIQRFDELTVVKEMVTPITERVRIVDFVDNEMGDRVLKSPDMSNVESPVQRRTTDFKTENSIVTSDAIVSKELKNKIISASEASAELNINYRNWENVANFSSVEKRIENFKYKLELIESYTASSSSLSNVSGSTGDKNVWDLRINEVKNQFDHFEKYMYFESSSAESSSLGQFYSNAWPKTSGGGTVTNPYVLAHTTSSVATTWYENNIVSASLFDDENLNKLSSLLPQHLIDDTSNDTYLAFTDMIGHHFDNIWVYVKALGDIYDRRESLSEGMSKDVLYAVGQSLGWRLNDSSDLVSLPRYHSGNEVTGSSVSTFSATSQKDLTREIWSRIINNMPFFLKNKGTIKALKGLINVYGIPSTILRVKEYGGPKIKDDEAPQFEITRKFTKALDFKGSQYVTMPWVDDTGSGRKPDTIEFRFRAVSSSNQILVEKKAKSPNVSSSFYIRLKDNGSADDYGTVAFQLSGSNGLKEISSSAFPVYDGDFYSVMLRRTSGSDTGVVSQSFQLSVGKYDASRSKIHLFSAVTMSTDIAASSSYNLSYANDGDIFIGGSANNALVGSRLTGSMMEYRQWTETLGVKPFKNHIANPQAYNGNNLSSSYDNLVLRYSFNDNKDLSSDTDGIRDVSSNQTTTVSGSHNGFTGNFFSNVVDELKSHIPSIGALRRTTKKIRIEDNSIKPGEILQRTKRATVSQYDTAANDSNKVGIYFAPTDVINNDIIQSVGDLNFENYLGDPRDREKLSYRGLRATSNTYWQKYTEPNNFWDYIRLLRYYDQSLYPQLRKLVPARAKADIGLLVEPNIFERPKVIVGREPEVSQDNYRTTIDVSTDYIEITGSYNAGVAVTTTDHYSDTIRISNTHESGSNIVVTGSYDTYNGTISEQKDRNFDKSLWQVLTQPGLYVSASVTQGDIKYKELQQPMVTGSRIYGRNQKQMKFYTTVLSHSLGLPNSSSFYNVDLDNLVDHDLAKFRSFYSGVKNTPRTTIDGGRPVEITITSPTKLVTDKDGESTLKTGDGKQSKFKFKGKKKKRKKGISKFGIGADGIPAPISFDLDFKNLLRTEQTLINKFAGKSAGDPDATKSKKLKKKKKGGKKFKKKKSSFKFDFGGKK